MYTGLHHTHLLAVILFLLLYLVKTGLLLANKTETLDNLTKKVKVPEMIISTLFLLTGASMLFMIPEVKTLMWVKLGMVFTSIPLAVVGFKKKNKVLAILAVLLIIGAYGMAEMSKKATKKELSGSVVTNPTDANYDLNLHGSAVYTAQCAQCHGETGDLQLAGAKNLAVSVLPTNEILTLLQEGKGAMPSYSNIMSEQERLAVASYVQTLRK